MEGVNYEVLHHFIEGLKGDFAQHSESPNSYQNALNGRLYSHNGVVSFSSLKGTKKVYKNEGIVKYLGYWAFEDELIIFVKCLPTTVDSGGNGSVEYETIEQLIASTINISAAYLQNSISVNLDSNITLQSYQIPIYSESEDPFEFNIPYSCINSSGNEIDFSEYYQEVLNSGNIQVCQLKTQGQFENNKEYIDCIFSLKKDSSGNIYDKLIWSGLMNWPLDGKICTYGIYENNFYKRIYFTDYANPFRVINLKDPNVSSRNAKELSTFQQNVLLQPKIQSLGINGQLKAGTILYTYRLITDNGQITEFSPFSEAVRILKDDDGYDYAGGDISEITNKSVTIKCNIIGWENYNEIECVAIEYEAVGSPTAIRSLGIKSVGPVVYFEHFGNEAEFSSDLTLSDILVRKNTWKYCSDLNAKKNKLVAIGLRNDPLPTELLRLNQYFALHSWDENGETHECLINPKPWKYRFIDPTNTGKMFYIKQRLYNSIQVFGSFNISLTDTLTAESINNSFISNNNQTYQDWTYAIYQWLNSIQNTATFQTKFPNVKIDWIQNKLVFEPIDATINTDFSNIKFVFNTQQVIEDLQDDVQFINLTVSGPLVYGAMSLGYNDGNGIRITFETEQSEVLQKATSQYPGSQPILNIKTPSSKKGFFKGEIYRLGLQIYDNNGSQLFTIPLGDMKIPELGEQKKYIDANGNAVIKNSFYVNSRVIDDKLYAERIIMRVEVRLSCEIQKLVSMYQLVYVERDDSNRTILCQGIAAPMERVNKFYRYIELKDPIANKWNIPYYGGPTYDWNGLNTYDQNGAEYENEWDWDKRVVTHRSLMYFDAPELIFNRISDEKVKNGSLHRIGRLNTDHSRGSIRQTYGESYPAFSRKIYYNEITGEEKRKSDFINISVFLDRPGINDFVEIDKAQTLTRGQIMPGGKLNVTHEVSNNALALQKQPWFYSAYARHYDGCWADDGARSELFEANSTSIGQKTMIIKTKKDVFTNEFINQPAFRVDPEVRDPYGGNGLCYDTHGLFNIKMNNEENVYGGRSELAYSKNLFIPLGETIPVLKSSNNAQLFKVHGDTYTTLYVRLKNQYNSDNVRDGWKLNNSGGCENKHEEHGVERNGAWAYAFVVECSFEPKWTYKDTFYKLGHPFDFQREYVEAINEAYYQENTLRSYIPKPYNFKDDPNMGNIIAVSDIKMNGDYIDKWTSFKVNNFYELEKDKGVGYNVAKYLDDLYAIQEYQTSLLMIDENVMVPSTQGEIAMKQGSGEGVSNSKIISDYGTSIRRAIVEIISNNKNIGGFTFFDEKRFEWIKVDQTIFIEKNLHLKIREIFENDKIIDTEGYFDNEYKETNIRIRTKSSKHYMLSFNEKFIAFNGWFDYDNDIYMVWNDGVYSPKTISVIDEKTGKERPDSSSLHQLNKGIFLNFFGDQKTMKLAVTININAESIKIFKHWCGILNIDYPIKNMIVKTSSGQVRILNGLHYRYQIKEERHSLPLKNRNDWEDLRGEWATLEIEVESKNNKKVDIFSFINFVRHSYQ